MNDIYEFSIEANNNEPELINFDPWGNRIDFIKVSKAWKSLEGISAEEGLISIAYERNYQEYSRVYQMAKLYLFTPSSAIPASSASATSPSCAWGPMPPPGSPSRWC